MSWVLGVSAFTEIGAEFCAQTTAAPIQERAVRVAKDVIVAFNFFIRIYYNTNRMKKSIG